MVALAAGQTQAGFALEQIGELVAVNYPPEEEVALYLEGSAEVLICSQAEWQAVRSRLTCGLSEATSSEPGADGERLRELLQTLGVSVP